MVEVTVGAATAAAVFIAATSFVLGHIAGSMRMEARLQPVIQRLREKRTAEEVKPNGK